MHEKLQIINDFNKYDLWVIWVSKHYCTVADLIEKAWLTTNKNNSH
jgi:hypothetical protein